MNHYTIWQTSARNPYSLLTVPVEETLHVLLRPYTHQAIRAQIATGLASESGVARTIVDEWLEVEEAVVGGLMRAGATNISARSWPRAWR